MEDLKIVNMLVSRDENGLVEAEKQYGKLCHYVANNILKSPPDAQECVNDTLLRAWNSIPPTVPDRLGAYLSKISRNLAIDKYNAQKSDKRMANDGAIIQDKDLNKIFDRFYQTDKTSEGSGLGLAIAKAICNQNNWNISCSNKNKLTSFTITF